VILAEKIGEIITQIMGDFVCGYNISPITLIAFEFSS
jgi:hypothetical protein